MSFFDNRPQVFRLLFVLLAAALLSLSAINLYRFASSSTDENAFWTSPGNLYLAEDVPATIIKAKVPEEYLSDVRMQSLRVGDLLLAVNGQTVNRLDELEARWNELPPTGSIEIVVFRPLWAKEVTFQVATDAIAPRSFREIPPSVYVLDVSKDGASDRAGMEVGDLILEINGQSFKDALDADRILRQAQIGKSIAYQILRGNQSQILHVTIAKAGIRLSFLVMILSGLLFMAVGIFVAISRPQFRAARLLGLAFICTGFFMSVLARRSLDDRLDYLIGFLLVGTVFFSISLWLHMSHYFPININGLIEKKWVRQVSYALASLSTVLSLLVTKGWVFFLCLTVMILYNIIVSISTRKLCSSEYRKLNRPIRWGSMLGGISTTALVVIIALLESSKGGINIGPLIGYIGLTLAIIPLSFLYAIGQYRLLNLDLRVRRNIQYNLATGVWGLAALAALIFCLAGLSRLQVDFPNVQFVGTFIELVDEPIPAARQEAMGKILAMLLGIGATVLLWRARRFGQRFIDRKFYRSQYDYRRAAAELAEVMATRLTLDSLARGIVEKLANLMQVKEVGILFIRKEQQCCCAESYGLEEKRWRSFCLSVDEEVVRLIRDNRSDYRFSIEFLPAEVRPAFEKAGFRHIIGIRSAERLVGILLIGEKLSESPFHKDDLAFLAAVARQASVAIENAFLYEELAERERLKHELEIARRIQLASLPQTTPRVQGLEISGKSIPALEVGGDYFDYLNGLAGEITVIVGDVSGKGTSAALYMSRMQGIMRSLHDFGLSPRDLFIRANQLLCGNLEKQSFITAVGASFRTAQQQLRLARAGHMPLFHFHAARQEVDLIVPRGMGLGLADSQIFAEELEEMEIPYSPGDIFLFVTDGVTEAHNTAGREFGESELIRMLKDCNGRSADDIRDCIIAGVEEFAQKEQQHDDLTVVVVKAS